MAKVSPTELMSQVDVDSGMPQLRLPDTDSTAEIILTQALDFCAEKMGLAGRQAAADRLGQCDSEACKYCHYSIAKQTAEAFGSLDENVKAVYVIDYDATPEDLCFGKTEAKLIHLIIWSERKTQALDSLVQALDRALVERYVNATGTYQLTHLLDAQVINDDDVKNRVGYGAMLASLHQRPIQVWER